LAETERTNEKERFHDDDDITTDFIFVNIQ